MFDIGFWEILIILVVALLVVGPDRLPGLAREVGTWVRKIRGFVTSVRSDIEQEFQTEELRKLLNEQNKEIDQLKNLMKDTEEALRSTDESLRSEVEETAHLVKSIESGIKDDTAQHTADDAEAKAAPLIEEQGGHRADAGGVPDSSAGDTAQRKHRDDPET